MLSRQAQIVHIMTKAIQSRRMRPVTLIGSSLLKHDTALCGRGRSDPLAGGKEIEILDICLSISVDQMRS